MIDNQLWITNENGDAKVIFPIEEKIEEEFGQKQGFETGYNCDLKRRVKRLRNG